jgi:hypothetical protein
MDKPMNFAKGSACSLGDWLKGSEVDILVKLTNEINGKGKTAKRLTRSFMTQTDRMSN